MAPNVASRTSCTSCSHFDQRTHHSRSRLTVERAEIAEIEMLFSANFAFSAVCVSFGDLLFCQNLQS